METFLLKVSCVFFLFFCFNIRSTEAQVIYTDVLPDSVFSNNKDTVSVDLNHDGIVDFYLTIKTKTTSLCGTLGSRINKYLIVTPADTNNSVLNSANLPSALALNTTIDSSSQFWKHTSSQNMASDTFRCSSGGRGRPGPSGWINSGSGNFRNTTNKYLAVRFYGGTQLYYGWIQFNVSSKVTVTLKDYAYQSSGKPSILAGQNSDNFIVASAPKASQLCAGDSFNVGYALLGNFDPANVVSVEFSDSVGNFNNGTIIGSDMGNISGTISCIIPLSFSGAKYRFRVISSNPTQIETDNGTNLIINNSLPDTLLTPAKKQFVCSGSSVTLTAPLGNGYSYQWKKDGVNISGSASTSRLYTANTTGLFSCDISNACGTVHSKSVSLTVLTVPAAYITPTGPLTINSWDSVVLSSSSVDPALIYRWYRNSILLNPVVSSMTYAAKISGTYTLKIIEQVNGCSKTSSGVVLNVLNISAVPETYAAQSYLKVQPNPFSNAVFISLSMQERQKFSVRIVDLTGRLVKTIASDVSGGNNFEYNWMADDQNGNLLNSGIYFLKLEAETFSQTEKLVLVR